VILEFNEQRWGEIVARHDDWAHTAILNRLEVETDRMRTDLLAPRPLDSPEATVTITESTPTRYRMRAVAPRYTLVVSSIPWWPGWKVTRNGARTPVIRVNGTFVGFAVPPGTYDVEVWYAPASFRAGAAISLATILALVAVAVRRVTVRHTALSLEG
jgi:hypothetical protein